GYPAFGMYAWYPDSRVAARKARSNAGGGGNAGFPIDRSATFSLPWMAFSRSPSSNILLIADPDVK
ncbi:MAG TPA: hypothetical protein VJB15_12390, partial [Rhodothermia bacterium]|nr:hypothetical protein [Rhodothermia bacterium]